MSASDEEAITEFVSRVGDALLVLGTVTDGDYGIRCAQDLPEDHPLGALFAAINQMIDALQASHEQNEALIRSLSAPIIEVWEGVLCLVLVGTMDLRRTAETLAGLLRAVSEHHPRCVIIDITAVEHFETERVDQFLRMVKAVRLLGTKCVLTGVQPGVARAMTDTGLIQAEFTIHRTLRDALQHLVREESRVSARETRR